MLTCSNTKVSVVIPCFNQAQFLPEAVSSLQAQTLPNWECLIVNDGSTDNTEGVASSLASGDSRLRLLSKSNAGLAAARNTGFAHAVGDYFLPLDADDKLHPSFLEKTSNYLDSCLGVDIVGTHTQIFGDRELTHHNVPASWPEILRNNTMHYCSTYRAAVWELLGGYDETLEAMEDWNFWVRAVRLGLVCSILPEYLFLYRDLSTGATHQLHATLDSWEHYANLAIWSKFGTITSPNR